MVFCWIVYETVLFLDVRIPKLWVHAFIAFYLHLCSDFRSENWVNMLDAEMSVYKRKMLTVEVLFFFNLLFIYSFILFVCFMALMKNLHLSIPQFFGVWRNLNKTLNCSYILKCYSKIFPHVRWMLYQLSHRGYWKTLKEIYKLTDWWSWELVKQMNYDLLRYFTHKIKYIIYTLKGTFVLNLWEERYKILSNSEKQIKNQSKTNNKYY